MSSKEQGLLEEEGKSQLYFKESSGEKLSLDHEFTALHLNQAVALERASCESCGHNNSQYLAGLATNETNSLLGDLAHLQ